MLLLSEQRFIASDSHRSIDGVDFENQSAAEFSRVYRRQVTVNQDGFLTMRFDRHLPVSVGLTRCNSLADASKQGVRDIDCAGQAHLQRFSRAETEKLLGGAIQKADTQAVIDTQHGGCQ